MQLQTNQNVERVLTQDVEVIVGRVRPRPLDGVLIAEVCSRRRVVHHIRMPCVGHAMDERRPVVETKIRTQCQALQRGNVDESITKDTPHLQAVVTVVIELAQRVLAVTHATHGTRERSVVLFIDGQRRRHLQGVLQRLAIDLARVSNGGILAHGHYLIDFISSIDTTREALEVGVLQDTIVVLVACREEC